MKIDFDSNQASLMYFSGYYEIIKPGSFVKCAVTNTHINLDNLRYWNAELQEAYVSCEVSFNRMLEKL